MQIHLKDEEIRNLKEAMQRSKIDRTQLESELCTIVTSRWELEGDRERLASKEEELLSQIENLKSFQKLIEEECSELRQYRGS